MLTVRLSCWWWSFADKCKQLKIEVGCLSVCLLALRPCLLLPAVRNDSIELIESKPAGILALLDEQCLVPKGTDRSFASNIYRLLTANPRFSVPHADKVSATVGGGGGVAKQFSNPQGRERLMKLVQKRTTVALSIYPYLCTVKTWFGRL